MNEKMREMVGKGELSEASYKQLVDELGRQKEEADAAPLFEVAFIVNTVSAYSFTTEDEGVESINQLENDVKYTCVMHGAKDKGHQESTNFFAGRLLLNPLGKLWEHYKPGLQFKVGKVDPHPSFTIYTIIEIKPFSACAQRAI